MWRRCIGRWQLLWQFWTETAEIVGPFWVAVDSECFFHTTNFLFLEVVGRRDEFGTTSEGMDGGEFV